MTAMVTELMTHHLVAGSHAEGITCLAVAAAVEYNEHTLLVAVYDDDFGTTWQLPADLVLPGETLLDALHRTVSLTTGLDATDVTGYLGHHDQHIDSDDIVRVFVFTVTVDDPERVCRTARVGHRWTDEPITAVGVLGDHHPIRPATAADNPTGPPPTHQLSAALRANAKGILCTEAAVELLIKARSWLHRVDFVADFVDSFTPTGQPCTGYPHTAFVDWAAALTALEAGHLPCSDGEGQLLRIAASLAEGIPVDLRGAVTGLDASNTGLVVQAIRHTAGHRVL
ncbi:MAG: NUDIX domain-containing protein [Mycobacteriales bacterium]